MKLLLTIVMIMAVTSCGRTGQYYTPTECEKAIIHYYGEYCALGTTRFRALGLCYEDATYVQPNYNEWLECLQAAEFPICGACPVTP